jgi:hypothetical protein
MTPRSLSVLALLWAGLAALFVALMAALPATATAADAPVAAAAPVAVAASAAASAAASVAAPAAAAASAPASAPATVSASASASESTPAAAASAASAPDPAPAALDARVQQLKADVIRLNRDLLVLEEELLFPAGTQVALFVSMDVGRLFELESVQIKLDDKLVATHLYTPLEVQALHRGGVQRVFVGNLRAGKHQVAAFFTGRGPHERDYKRGASIEFEKGTEPRYIELRIKDTQAKLQPEFEVKVW